MQASNLWYYMLKVPQKKERIKPMFEGAYPWYTTHKKALVKSRRMTQKNSDYQWWNNIPCENLNNEPMGLYRKIEELSKEQLNLELSNKKIGFSC